MISIFIQEVRNKIVTCKIRVPYSLKSFFRNDKFFVEYDESIESVPEPIMVIPAVMSIAPLAWASNVKVFTPVLDECFYHALKDVRSGYAKMYPAVFSDSGPTVLCDKLVSVFPLKESSRSAILFSGGVDSTAAVLDMLEKSPALVVVHGSDISLNNFSGWKNVYKYAYQFAKLHKLPIHAVRSNFREIFRYRFIDYEYESKLGRSWWGAVQHGTALPALCAPLAWKHGYKEVILASEVGGNPTYTGAQLIFVNKLAWSGTNVFLADAEISRQKKIARIGNYIHINKLKITIRSCLKHVAGYNCSRCLKCRRTIIGFILEDIDLNTVGFLVNNNTLPEIRREFETGHLYLYGTDILY